MKSLSTSVGSRAKVLVGALALATGASHATTTQLDLTSIANDHEGIGQPVGEAVGNTGSTLSSLSFNLVSTSNLYTNWLGSSTGATLDLTTGIYGATAVDTLLNTRFGQLGATALTVEFKGSAGADQTFNLVGGVDVRDYNNWVWTNTINGTTTQEWWTNNLSPTPTDQSHRLDAQNFSLSAAFATQTLTDIIFTAGAAGENLSEPALFAVDVVSSPSVVAAVPEPSTYAMMFGGLGALCFIARRRKG